MRIRVWSLTAFLLSSLAAPLAAQTFNVNSTDDIADPTPNDTCDVGGGVCTLRAAIQTVNFIDGPGQPLISLPAGTYSLSLAEGGDFDDGSGGDLDILAAVRIEGAGEGNTIIRMNVPDQAGNVLHIVNPGITVNLANLTVADGAIAADGAGILNNGGILSLDHVTVRDNTTFGANGGGIFSSNGAKLSLSNCTVSGNHALNGGNAAGIFNDIDSELNVSASTISGNTAEAEGDIGGVNAGIGAAGMVNITDSTIRDNVADHTAAILVEDGELNMTGSTVSGNQTLTGSTIIGSDAAPLNLTNCTVSGNTMAATGGAIGTSGAFHGVNVTIVNNASGGGSGAFATAGDDVLFLKQSIVAGNTAGGQPADCPEGFDLNLEGYNLIGKKGNCVFASDPTGLQTDVDPLLGPLQDNGGPTPTHALLEGSPAIDSAGDTCVATDQRGVSRPQLAACDIGAFEFEPEPTPIPTGFPGDIGGGGCSLGGANIPPTMAIALAWLVGIGWVVTREKRS